MLKIQAKIEFSNFLVLSSILSSPAKYEELKSLNFMGFELFFCV